eukprot:TRINITY_DN9826_c0_g1_i6.p1 TRINITY_DN9826_c0_g1~~TRINITY_DN9826_c0_g1_i6.p1  ORF type:complete len:223 (+),score=32.21 TRINITY_DN9826_c0_g1_i6:100-768(+)
MAVHKDTLEECGAEQYSRFLCNSPIVEDGVYGSFHYHYRIDGKLIAVGVVDLLPKCLSAVYFFYDPDYDFLSPGVLSSLLEIEEVQKLAKQVPDLHYYYMGYYIHTCVKMRYKGQYRPSDLLCPERFTWHSLAECRPLLEQSPYVVFSDHVACVEEGPLPPKLDMQRDGARLMPGVKISLRGKTHTYQDLGKRASQTLNGIVSTYAALVGEKLSRGMCVDLG